MDGGSTAQQHRTIEASAATGHRRRIRFGRLRWWVEESPPAFSTVALLILVLVALFWVLTALDRRPTATAVELSLQPVAVTPTDSAGSGEQPTTAHRELLPDEPVPVAPLPEPAIEVGKVDVELEEFRPEEHVQEASKAARRLQEEAAQARDYLEKLRAALSGRASGSAGQGGAVPGDPNSTAARIARWVIRYPRVRPTEYAHLLDYFNVELGWLVGEKIQYVSGFTAKLRRRVGSYRSENRVFWYPVDNFAPLDNTLLKSLGIEPSGTVIHFYPKRIEARLARLELTALRESHGTDDLTRIEQTIFGIRRHGRGWRFHVLELRLIAPNPLDSDTEPR